MKQKKCIFVYLITLFVIFLSFSYTVFADGDGYLYMSEDLCQISCEDEENKGHTYTVAMSAKVQNDGDGSHNGQTNGGCALEVNDFLYEDGVLLSQKELRNLPESDLIGELTETYGRGFITLLLIEAQRADIFWKILYTGYVALTSTDDIITATYTHQINPCAISGNYVEITAWCDDTGWNWRGISVGCNIYKDGVKTAPIITEIEGNPPDTPVVIIEEADYPTYYYRCENDGDSHNYCERP